MHPIAKIALVEDDDILRCIMIEGLSSLGYDVWGTGSAGKFYKKLLTSPVDVVILDIGLPGESGIEMTRHLSAMGGPTVIILSGRTDLHIRLEAFQAGAERFLSKPFELLELAANVDACLRRSRAGSEEAWELHQANWTLRAPDGQMVGLTPAEWQFMLCLAQSEGQTANRRNLAIAMGYDLKNADIDKRMDMMVSRLRSKLRTITSKEPIKTLQGRGFAILGAIRVM